MFQCDECKRELSGNPVQDAYTFQGARYGICADCQKYRDTGVYRIPEQLQESGAYAWPGGYSIVFYPTEESGELIGDTLCHTCAVAYLRDNEDAGIRAEIETEQANYGGQSCDDCHSWIIEPCCPECANEITLDTPVLHSDSVDALYLCQKCAVKLVTENRARRIPGIGVEIITTIPESARKYRWNDGTPWYASHGTIYRYPHVR